MRRHSIALSLIIILVGSTLGASWPGTAAASDYQKLGIGETFGRWPDGVVPWVYNSTDAPAVFSDEAYFVAQFQEAIAELEGVSGLAFDYQGTSNADFDTNDGVVVVGWESLGGATAGQAGPRVFNCFQQDVTDMGYCPYNDGSVKFDSDGSTEWDKGVMDFTERNFQQVAVHELLHLVGIGHSEVAQSIMFAFPYTNLSHPREDDIDGLQSLYGEPDQLSPAPVYMPPAGGASPLLNSYISLSDDAFNTNGVAVIDGTETATHVGLAWQIPGDETDDLSFVVTDPDGYFYEGRIDTRECGGGGSCTLWTSIASMETIFSFPGVWTVYLIYNDQLATSLSFTVTTDPTVLDQAPDSTFTADVIYGPAPLTVKMTLDVTGDTEGDAVDATWHIPTVGIVDLDSGNFPGSAGTSTETVTFDTPGEYEVYVEVNDDWVRYGSQGAGNAAGPGFRTLYRTVVRVTKRSDDVTTFQDVNADNVPDLATHVGGYNGKPQINIFSGDDGSVISNRKYLTTAWRGIALGTIRDGNQNGVANDPAVALLADHKVNGKIAVEIRSIGTGASLGKILFRNASWRAIDVVVIDDLNVDGNTNDSAIAVLAQHRTNGKISVQIKRLSDRSLVKNINYHSAKWTAIAAAVVDRSNAGLPPLIGVLSRNNTNGKQQVQSKQVDTKALYRTTNFWDLKWTANDVTVNHSIDGLGTAAWQVLAVRKSDGIAKVQTKVVFDGSLDSSLTILTAKWEGFRLDSALDMNTNVSRELAVSMQKRINGKRRIHVKDFDTKAQIINIHP